MTLKKSSFLFISNDNKNWFKCNKLRIETKTSVNRQKQENYNQNSWKVVRVFLSVYAFLFFLCFCYKWHKMMKSSTPLFCHTNNHFSEIGLLYYQIFIRIFQWQNYIWKLARRKHTTGKCISMYCYIVRPEQLRVFKSHLVSIRACWADDDLCHGWRKQTSNQFIVCLISHFLVRSFISTHKLLRDTDLAFTSVNKKAAYVFQNASWN